jgi:hypothetical protein
VFPRWYTLDDDDDINTSQTQGQNQTQGLIKGQGRSQGQGAAAALARREDAMKRELGAQRKAENVERVRLEMIQLQLKKDAAYDVSALRAAAKTKTRMRESGICFDGDGDGDGDSNWPPISGGGTAGAAGIGEVTTSTRDAIVKERKLNDEILAKPTADALNRVIERRLVKSARRLKKRDDLMEANEKAEQRRLMEILQADGPGREYGRLMMTSSSSASQSRGPRSRPKSRSQSSRLNAPGDNTV